MRKPSFLLSPMLLGLTCLLALLLWLALPAQTVISLMSEDGPVESATVVAYALAVVAIWLLRASTWPTRLASSMVLLMFAAREMDLHRSLFGMSMLKSRFYLSAPLLPRLTALAILLPLVLALVYLVWKHARPLWRGLRQRQTVAVTLACFFAALIASKAIDRSLNVVFELFSYASPLWLQALQLAFEETLELLLPVLAIVAARQSASEATPVLHAQTQ